MRIIDAQIMFSLSLDSNRDVYGMALIKLDTRYQSQSVPPLSPG